MSLVHLPAAAPADEVADVLDRDGCVVIDRLLDRATTDAVRREMAPHIASTSKGGDAFEGFETRRAGMLVARSPTSRPIIMNPTVLEATARVLARATTFQLHVTETIDVGPGSAPQPVHRDQWAFDYFPFPVGHEALIATMWALSDFTEANGATRVIPGSHRLENRLEFSQSDTEPAEMEAGSLLLYTGSLYHGAGENRSDAVRSGLIVHYSLGWLRQEENQYLSVPQEILQTLPEDLLRLMGYAHGSYSLGFIDAGRDPIVAIRPEFENTQEPIGYEELARRITEDEHAQART
jgi:ectoine hydroxylase-related dioxygenase (phytanoyl-CoA dioxygenase family)